METRHNRFGQKHIVFKAHFDSITDGPPVKLDKNSLDKFVTDLTNCQIVMEAWNFTSELNSSQTLKSVFRRLPVPLQRKFVERVDLDADEHFAKFKQLVKFVKELAMRTNSFFGQVLADAEPNKKLKQQTISKGSKVFSVQTMPAAFGAKPTLVCPDCSANHQLWKCECFKSKPVQHRWIFVEKQKLCFHCLGSKHTRNICRCSQKCKNCNKPHHTLLHADEMTTSANRAKQNHCDGASQTVASVKSVAVKTVYDNLAHILIPLNSAHQQNCSLIFPTEIAYGTVGDQRQHLSQRLQQNSRAIDRRIRFLKQCRNKSKHHTSAA